MLTFTIALAMWAFLRALDDEEPHPRLWSFIFAASLGVGLLLKSLIAVVVSRCHRRDLSFSHAPAFLRANLEANSSIQRHC